MKLKKKITRNSVNMSIPLLHQIKRKSNYEDCSAIPLGFHSAGKELISVFSRLKSNIILNQEPPQEMIQVLKLSAPRQQTA